MKQLSFFALIVTIGIATGLPAPKSEEMQVMDSKQESDIVEFDENVHETHKRDVSPCKNLFLT